MDRIQGALDAGGVVEPTPFCDLTNSVISTLRGNWADAGCSLAGCIPYIGDTGKVVKYGRKASHAADAAEIIVKAPSKAAQMNKLSAGEIKMLQKNGIDPHDLKPNSRYDLFKDKDGNIYVKPKNGIGPGDPTGINVNR